MELAALGSSLLIMTEIKSDEESPSSVAPCSSNLRLEERRSRRGCMEPIEVSTRDIEDPRQLWITVGAADPSIRRAPAPDLECTC
ncbi:hypothetical protein U1Q18_003037 [Sarracenia purpurea var. burkii]